MAGSVTPQGLLIHYEKTLSLKQQAALKFNLLAEINNGRYYEGGKWHEYTCDDRDIFFGYCEGLKTADELRMNQRMDALFNQLAAYSGGRFGWVLEQVYKKYLENTDLCSNNFITQKVIDKIKFYAS